MAGDEATGDLQSSLTRLKLMSALKNGQEEVAKIIHEKPEVAQQRALLHLAVQIANLSTIEGLVKDYKLDVNQTDVDGNTPLHFAARLGRQDVALFLMSKPEINDTLVNKANKQAVEEAKTPEIAEVMQIARARYVERIATELRKYLDEENVSALEELLSHPRASSLLDINGQDPDTGSTVLHDFVRKKNYKMVEFILKNGGDPFRRDSKGVLPADICKDDNIKKLLKSATKEQPVIAPKTLQESPSIKGYLKKWTNFTGGYKLRWFVLENGVLSYYKRQEDTDRACRGSINMKNATLHLDSSEKLRFEILTSGSAKFHIKANHPVETNRWVWALTNSIQYAKDQEKSKAAGGSGAGSGGTNGGTTGLGPPINRTSSVRSKATSQIEPAAQFSKEDSSAVVYVDRQTSSLFENDLGKRGDEEEFDDDSEYNDSPPYEDQQGMVEDSIQLEIKGIHELLQTLVKHHDDGTLNADALKDGLATVGRVVDTIGSAVSQLVNQVEARENFYQNKLDRSEAQQRLWAQNIRDLEMEHEKVQQEYEELQIKTDTAPAAESESDTEDEFFDVEEPESTEEEAEEKQKQSDEQQKIEQAIESEDSYRGYEDGPRQKMSIDDDKRPKISLWGVLKNLIGKDMTRMTLPVSFNECTNLLQRSAEDMEYVELLDKAAKTDDESLRMAYIAAFCTSSYSSTINRIAKPFNPLLGETFEYCRPDKGYRLFAEQVSHHPPIGAMLAEHKKWDFFGNSHVISKFLGRSFEIKPTGDWFIRLRPDSGGEELISYRKVTSSVVGIITGRPVVDNHGEMMIKNHTTGWECKLTFAAMGWRNQNAYEVSGDVVSPQGEKTISICGKWNDKLFYVKDGHKVCVWQAHERPPAPFNLTPFAITLNALPESLKDHIAPTDTRFRPDQRAMEEGRYDDAREDKHRVEQKQRAARKQREEQGETYKPKWFDETTHPITGELFYKPHGDYWQKRQNGTLKEVSMDIF